MATVKCGIDLACGNDKQISNYRVKTTELMNTLTRNFRGQGYQVITFGEKVRELEKGNHTVIITKEK